MMMVTLRIVAKSLFDADVTSDAADASEAMETLMRNFTARINRLVPIPAFVPTGVVTTSAFVPEW